MMFIIDFADNLFRGVCILTNFILTRGVNVLTFLYIHLLERENNLTLSRKKEEAEVDMLTNTVSRSIARLDANIALLKESIALLTLPNPTVYSDKTAGG